MNLDDHNILGASDARQAMRGLRVLVVEGSEEGRRSLGALLRSLGMEPTLMAQAQAAIEELRRAAREGRPYALLLFDSALRGSVVFRARRAYDDPLFSVTPRIELAAEPHQDAEPHERELLQKPVTRGALLEVLERALAHGAPTPTPAPIPSLVAPSAPKVLLMGTDPVSDLVAARFVELAGGHPVVASSPEEALAAVETVDVALLDATRPDAALQAESLRQARPGLRLLQLDPTLDADELRARLVPPRADGAGVAEERARTPLFDRRGLASRLGGDDEAAQRVLDRFVEQAGARLLDLGVAASSGDPRAIEQQAHRLRGGLAWIGAARAASVATEIEELCRAGDTQRATGLCQALRDETEGVVTAIREEAERPRG